MPISPGTFDGVITVSNGSSSNATQPFTIIVSEPIAIPSPIAPIITSPAPASPATVGTTYNHTVTATGTETISFMATGLPPGLGITENGIIRGIPNSPGTFTGHIIADNGTAPNAKQVFSIIVAQPTDPISLSTEEALLALSPVELNLPAEIDGGDSALTKITWQQISGPTATIQDKSLLSPSVQFSTIGEYSFRVEATDGSTFDQSVVDIKLIATPPPSPPVGSKPLTLYPLQFFFDGVGVYWDSVANARYHLGVKRDLNSPYWILIEADIPSHGDSYTYWVDDSIDLHETGFYTIFEER